VCCSCDSLVSLKIVDDYCLDLGMGGKQRSGGRRQKRGPVLSTGPSFSRTPAWRSNRTPPRPGGAPGRGDGPLGFGFALAQQTWALPSQHPMTPAGHCMVAGGPIRGRRRTSRSSTIELPLSQRTRGVRTALSTYRSYAKGDRHFLNPVRRAATLVLRPKQVLQTQSRSAGHLTSLSPLKSCHL